jgi:tetratricopeptide (TPR) repeat protein
MNAATQMEMLPETNSDWIRALSDEACRLHDAAVDAYSGAHIEEAEGLFRRALLMLGRVEGEDHPDVARVLNNLAAIYEDRCEYEAAERLYERSVRIMERPVGDGESGIIRLRLQSWQNLGRIHQAQGLYDQAEQRFKQALALSEQAFGNQGAEMARALNQLGVLYKYTGRFTEAGGLYQRALAILEHAGERDHLAMAEIYHNLGGLEHASRNFARGEPYARMAMKIRRRALGADHPLVAADMALLAALFDGQKKFREAEALYRRALAIFERVYGEEHYEIAVNLNNLAAVYQAWQAKGKREKAKQLYQRALAIKEKIFGPDHPDVAMTLNNLAVFYKSNKQYHEAEALYRRALAIFEKSLGPEHPNVPICLDNYAQLLRRMRRADEARTLEARAEQIRSGLNLLTEDDVAVTGTINPQFARFALAVRPSGIHRLGVFTEERIPLRRTVIEYTGERISRREAKRRLNIRAKVYLYKLDKYWRLDGAVGGSGAEYINHSCDPNLVARIINGRIYYRSKRQIEPGEELTVDYKFSADAEKTPCLCGSPKCRGTINRIKQRATRGQRPAQQ